MLIELRKRLRRTIPALCGMLLFGCSFIGQPPVAGLTAPQLREQAELSFNQKRYSTASHYLQAAIELEQAGGDYLQLADLYEFREKFSAARKTYQAGLKATADGKLQQRLLHRWATLEALDLENPEQAWKLAARLTAGSLEALNLEMLRNMQQQKYYKALELAEQVTATGDAQEVKGWTYFHAARAWLTVGNRDKAFQSLFHAINHARGHALVARITSLWKGLKRTPE